MIVAGAKRRMSPKIIRRSRCIAGANSISITSRIRGMALRMDKVITPMDAPRAVRKRSEAIIVMALSLLIPTPNWAEC